MITVGILFQLIFILNNLYYYSPHAYSSFWSEPAKKAIELADANPEFDKIFISDRVDNVEYALAVYHKLVPATKPEIVNIRQQSNLLTFKKYSNIYIGYIPDKHIDEVMHTQGKVLFIGSFDPDKNGVSDYDEIMGSDGLIHLITARYP